MKLLVKIRYSHALRLVPSWNPAKPRYARRYVSCTRSSASAGFLVIRSAAPYRDGNSGRTSRSKRSRSARSSCAVCAMVTRVARADQREAGLRCSGSGANSAALPVIGAGRCHYGATMPDNDTNKSRRPGADGPSGPGIPKTRLTPWILIALVVLALVAFNQWFSTASRQSIDLSRFYQLVDEGKITPGTKITISATQVTGSYTDDTGTHTFVATLPGSNYDPSTTLEPKLQAKGIDYTGTQPSPWFSPLASILPLVLLMGIAYYFLFRRVGGGAANPLNMGKNKVKIYDRKEMKTTFSDVAGVDEAKEELKEIVEFLKNPKKYQRLGGRIPKGVLLLGPPGCGKTLLARAVAGEANVPFFFMSGSEFVEMFVGLGAARVRELFQQAKERAPALVFIDELDTIGKGRGGALGAGFGAHDEREQTLNQLLVEMDGFDSSKGVIIMAATNRPDVLDPALVRPGRFDRQVVVDRADLKGREDILKVHVRGVALDPTVDLRVLASRTPGFTGADLANVINEAALLAARRERDAVTMVELEEAI